jgi:hypothetical protein
LQLTYDELASSFAFNFHLRRYSAVAAHLMAVRVLRRTDPVVGWAAAR